MKLLTWAAKPGNFNLLGRLQLILIILLSGSSVLCAGRYFLAHRKESEARQLLKQQNEALLSLRNEIAKQEKLPAVEEPQGLQTISEFRSVLQNEASSNACKVGDFQASPDIAPYLSVYKKNGNAGDWAQIDVRLSLDGETSAVFDTLRNLGRSGVLFEIVNAELSRPSGVSDVHPQVECKLEVHVLTKAAAK